MKLPNAAPRKKIHKNTKITNKFMKVILKGKAKDG